jgi:hypothetical protein
LSDQKICFVIAPIGQEGSDIRKRSDQILRHVIEPIVKKFGYTALRADKISKPGVITSQIIQYLLEASLVIADISGHNPNVFYELAVRHAARKPVIMIRQVGEPIPFDVAQNRVLELNHQDIDSVEECKTRLAEQVRSVDQSSTETYNPISTTIELLSLHASGNPSEKADAQIIAMLEDIRTSVSNVGPTRVGHIAPEGDYIAETEFGDEIPRKGISERREFSSANILKVEVKSTGYKGGDWGHGSRHYLSLHNEVATSWYVKVKDSEGKTRVFDQPQTMELLLGGDTELDTFTDSLEFAASVLRKATKIGHKD